MTRLYLRQALSSLSLAAAFCAMPASHSGNLPLFVINTDGGVPVESKELYVPASCYLDPNGSSLKALGSEEAPVVTEIRGRGNYTWIGFDKKPYKIKLNKKADLFGTGKNKHYALLAHADDIFGFLRNTVGFEMSRRLGMPWTPSQHPVEVYLNGEYIGLYFLTETIRVDENRVNIVEQNDNETDPELIKGGWLVEIDNYDDDPHITLQEPNGEPIFITFDTPEVLSDAQVDYLTREMSAINEAIYNPDKTSTLWEEYIDMDMLARYYLVQEIMDDGESFHGSCYLSKDLAEVAKWSFGPVWDFGNAFARYDKNWIFSGVDFNQTWIGEIARFPRFQAKVKEIWQELRSSGALAIDSFVGDFRAQIAEAAKSDADRWPQYDKRNLDETHAEFMRRYSNSVNWLGQQFDGEIIIPTPDPECEIYLRGEINGWDTSMPFKYIKEDGLYYLTNISLSGEFKVASADWTTVDFGGDGLNLVQDLPYQLKPTGSNIQTDADMNNIDLILDLEKQTLMAVHTGTLGISTPDSAAPFTIRAGEILADGMIRIYDAAGNLTAEGVGSLPCPSRGLHIVVTATGARKIIF